MPVTFFTISGNAGAAGVLVSATGASSGSTTSAADGTYTISGLIAGAYTITPTLTGRTFVPVNALKTIVGISLTGVNFAAQVLPNIGVGTASLGSALITPGYPLAVVPKSSPLAGVPNPTVRLPADQSLRRDATLAQIGETAARIV